MAVLVSTRLVSARPVLARLHLMGLVLTVVLATGPVRPACLLAAPPPAALPSARSTPRGPLWTDGAGRQEAPAAIVRFHPAILYRLPPIASPPPITPPSAPRRLPDVVWSALPSTVDESFESLGLQPLSAWGPSGRDAREFPVQAGALGQVNFADQTGDSARSSQPPSGSEGDAGGREGGETTLGTAPEDYGLQFLREATVLLRPGQWQFDYGLTYALEDDLLPVVLSNSTLNSARLRRRTLVVPFGARVGLTPSVQAFVNAPVGWGQSEFASSEFDLTENVGGIGDVSAGLNILVEPGQQGSPDIVFTLGMVAPTGNDAFGPSLSSASLGNGFWSVLADLRFIHSYDPVVIFWGAGYRWQLQRDVLGVSVDPGDEITYQLGVGFSVNERVTFSSALFGSIITETEVEGQGVPKSILEPIRLRLALTTVTQRKRIVEPFVILGLTPDATDAQVGVIVTVF